MSRSAERAHTCPGQVSHQRAGRPLRVQNDGASGETSASGTHLFGWRDAMDVLVRWRQLSEPNDQVRGQLHCLPYQCILSNSLMSEVISQADLATSVPDCIQRPLNTTRLQLALSSRLLLLLSITMRWRQLCASAAAGAVGGPVDEAGV